MKKRAAGYIPDKGDEVTEARDSESLPVTGIEKTRPTSTCKKLPITSTTNKVISFKEEQSNDQTSTSTTSTKCQHNTEMKSCCRCTKSTETFASVDSSFSAKELPSQILP